MSRMLLLGIGGSTKPSVAFAVGRWRLDEASGDRADISSLANTLTDINTVTSAAGHVGATAAQFTNANSEYLRHADSADFEVGAQSWSACGWIYMDTNATTRRTILAKFDGNADAGAGRGWELAVLSSTGNKLYVQSKDGTNNAALTHTTALTTATWYFVAGGWDAAQLKAWGSVNAGTRAHSGAAAAMSHGDETYTFRLGATVNPSANWYWDGRMEQMELFIGRLLTDAELIYKYNAGAGRVLI
jgi:concanavalin A-like lectin/glucanase superfamily protein